MRTFFARFLDLCRRQRRETALDEEIRAHLDLLATDFERRGMTPDEARFAARRAFGGVEQMKERHRERRTLPWLDDVGRDLRYAGRSLRRSPGFTVACTAILTLGIGLNLALFQLVNVTSLQSLPVREPESLARFVRLSAGGTNSTLPYAAVPVIQTNQDVLSAVMTQTFADVAWQGDASDRIRAAYVSANWFRELGYDAARGRVFSESIDERPDATPVVVLSHAFWQGRLGGDATVIGSVARVNDRPATVIGIAPPEFPGLRLRDVQVWIPIEQIEVFTPGSDFKTTWRNNTELYGRLRPGVGLAAARDGLRPAMAELARQQPDAVGATEWLEPYSASVRFESPRDRRQRMALVLTAGALTVLVLLIACANVNNLVLSRAGERLREVGIRTALGASRWRVIRQLMTESLALGVLGSAGGLLVGGIAADVIAGATQLPPFLDFSPDWRTIVAALAGSLLAMVAIGLYPAWRVSRHGVAMSLKDGGQLASSGLDRSRFRQLLIGAQVGGTCLLLLIAGLMLQNLQRALWSDPGFAFANVAVLDASVARYGITGPAAQAYWSDVKQSIAALPETEGVALVWPAPMGPDAMQSVYPDTGSLQVTVTRVEPAFFGLMQIPILAGRNFVQGDDPHATVIISHRLALAMYGSSAVIGQPFPRIAPRYADRFAGRPVRTIVGVADDARLIRLTATDGAELYWPIDPAEAGSLVLIAGARTDAARLLAPLRDAARRADSRVLAQARLMRNDFETRLSPIRLGSSVAGAIALLALSLACVGVFGAVSYGAAVRTKEIGIRVTLGAPHSAVIRLLLNQLLWPTAIGMLAGAAATVPAVGALRGAPFFLQTFDPVVHLTVIAVLAATVGVAALYPAVRALRLDPVGALRYE